MADNYVYLLDGKAYVNITNKCSNACAFCIRNTGRGVAGTELWLNNEPTAQQVLSAFEKLSVQSDEVVFCGYGEPTENLSVLIECAKAFKAKGYRTRLNTNGLGSKVNGRNIANELTDFDMISVSLNSPTADGYAKITSSAYGQDAFPAVLDFAVSCKAAGICVVFTVVDVIGRAEIDKCAELCKRLDIPLRVRTYVPDNYKDRVQTGE